MVIAQNSIDAIGRQDLAVLRRCNLSSSSKIECSELKKMLRCAQQFSSSSLTLLVRSELKILQCCGAAISRVLRKLNAQNSRSSSHANLRGGRQQYLEIITAPLLWLGKHKNEGYARGMARWRHFPAHFPVRLRSSHLVALARPAPTIPALQLALSRLHKLPCQRLPLPRHLRPLLRFPWLSPSRQHPLPWRRSPGPWACCSGRA